MRLLVYLPLLISVLAGAAARPLATRLEPRQATWLFTIATVALAGCSTVALALLATSAAARAPVLATLGHYSRAVVQRRDATSTVTGVAAAVLLAAAVLAVAVTLRSRARALAESYRRAARMHAHDGVVVIPGPAIEAYALPGAPGRVVVSAGLLSSLDEGGKRAVLAHERAHLSGRHHLFTAAAHLAAAANPLLLPLARSVDYTAERWADEDAARVTGDRRLVAATIGRVALLATATGRARAGAAALGQGRGRGGRAAGGRGGPGPPRVAALLAPPPARRVVLLAAIAAIVMLAGASALEAGKDLHSMLELAQAAR